MSFPDERDRERVDGLANRLVEEGLLAPVARDPREEEHWAAFDLASLVEIRLGETISPEEAASARETWAARVGSKEAPRIDRAFGAPYWIVSRGSRVGTAALGQGTSSHVVHLTSLFVRPERRGQRLATRVLERVMSCLGPAGLRRLHLETDWCAFRAVPLYLSLGMRVRMWKRDLAFVWDPEQPRWSIIHDDAGARCVVEGADVITARWRGDRLEWADTNADRERIDDRAELEGTFALALAARGLPLITTDEAWEQQLDWGFSDIGGPVGLAFKIQRWEAWARSRGWRVNAPRIPGLAYPSWEELERAAEARYLARSAPKPR